MAANAYDDRPMRRQLALMIMLALCPSGAQAAPLFRCTMIDGSERLGPLDLSVQFSGAVRGCEKLRDDLARPGLDGGGHGLTVLVKDEPRERPAPAVRLANAEPPEAFAPLIAAASQRNGLDPRLVNAVIAVESAHQPTARSPKGALGLMQIMPATGAYYGVRSADDLLDPTTNLEVGTRHLGDLYRAYPGRLDLALAAYNAGKGAVARHGNRVPPYPETVDYVRKILALYGDGSAFQLGMK